METSFESRPLSLKDVEEATPCLSDEEYTIQPLTAPTAGQTNNQPSSQPDTQEVLLSTEGEESISLSDVQESVPDTGDKEFEILKSRESTRSWLAYLLLGLFSLVIMTYIIGSAFFGSDEFKDAVQIALPLITGILGVAAGYYFSSESGTRGSVK